MFYIKNTIFLDLTKNQKSSLLSFIKSFVKKNNAKTEDDILNEFIEEETYYKDLGVPHFEWIIEKFENEKFLKDLKIYISECKKQLEMKEAQKPFIEKQKVIRKEQKKKLLEFKLSKEKPTSKQLYYYDKLCKKYNLEKLDTTELSKLDLVNMIGKIIDDYDPTAKRADCIEE